ncbi:hypothetical protein GCM10014715_83490 [Streptomyces spiralis]|uniref:Uncharacterized protein n=1 Tax=Streptomyces spiralis TaxID=66376 RepID=A0A919AP68_9ACTN|nr:hypothetical protein [Streptomyces spiralis]GHF15515.1 hypothetical protein GCM10014715_83490 [Streptomyces spiralis]
MLRIPAAAVAGCVVLGLSAPAAMATDGSSLIATVSPKTAKPGATVILTLRSCEDPSQGGIAEGALIGGETTARSPIGITELKPDATGEYPAGTLVGITNINEHAKRGTTERIYMACASNPNGAVETTVTIAP